MGNAVLFKIKLITMFVLAFPLDVASRCSPSEFLTEDNHCCRLCEPGYFITKNCTLRDSLKAKECSKCTGAGMKIITNCTTFSDTKCSCGDGYTTSSPGSCETVPTATFSMSTDRVTTDSSAFAAYALVSIAVVLFLITLIALFVTLFYWLRKARETDMFLKNPCEV